MRGHGVILAGLAAVAAFAVLAGRFWHPYYGFTKWVQLDELDAEIAVPEVRQQPVFVYPGANGYDGSAYAQIAYHPLLDSPDLPAAIGNVPYRARRILGSALAFALAGGQPRHIANVYAGLNIVVWLALAWLLWRVLPVTDARSWLAWAGVLFSAGALHSVRLALTDLLGATLVTAALWSAERNRGGRGLALLAAAGLARETALASVVGFWRGPWFSTRAWMRNLAFTVVTALPLLAWIIYIRWKVGPADQGFGNFSPPLGGWLGKWREVATVYVTDPDFRWLNTTTLLAVVALTVQAAWLLRRPRLENSWWRVGASGVALMIFLGTSVWEGQPGAATRVLLPMAIAFAVVAVRERAAVGWVIGGGLTVFSGVLALWHVPADPRELASGWCRNSGYVVRVDRGWFGVERDRGRAWAWCATEGDLEIKTAGLPKGAVQARIRLSAISLREVEVRQAGVVRWRGAVAERAQIVSFAVGMPAEGRLMLTIASEAPPVPEAGSAGARALGIAVYDVRLE